MEALVLDKVSRTYKKRQDPAVDQISLSIGNKEILAVVGESGSGKSTLLRLIAGLEIPDSGSIKINDEVVASDQSWVPPEKRQVGFVFQDGALFPHLTIAENVVYGIPRKQKDRDKLVTDYLELVGLAGFEKRYPNELSGGERQRVALARALTPEPRLLLLDEPFSNLDPSLRRDMREEISDILHRVGASAIMVTHDTEDALIVGDRIAIVRDGKIEQLGSPSDIFENPNNTYCARLFGPAFTINGQILRPDEVVLNAKSSKGSVEVVVKRIQQLAKRREAVVQPVDKSKGDRWLIELTPEAKWHSGETGWVLPKVNEGKP